VNPAHGAAPTPEGAASAEDGAPSAAAGASLSSAGATGGSTFANPPGDHAGRLLEACGMKGFRIGGASFSEKHANWIVNDDNATAADIRGLIGAARERVRERFGVELRQEVEEIGEP